MQFDALREKLLRAGVAPRHVRRYLRELQEHLADLTEKQLADGHEAKDAALRARAALGTDDDLAKVMLARRGIKSWSACAPWAIYFLLPPLATLLSIIVFISSLVIVAGTSGILDQHIPVPDWFQDFVAIAAATFDMLLVPIIALLFVAVARRQRLKPIWPLAGITMLLLLSIHMSAGFHAPTTYPGLQFRLSYHLNNFGVSIKVMPMFSIGAWRALAAQWPVMLVQWTLTILPLLWLWRISGAAKQESAAD